MEVGMERLECSPDVAFTKEVIANGGVDLKKCYQCATCSVVCPLAPDKNPFPRKEMIWGQWGLKERILADPDLWLCYACQDCSVQCPRGAKPGDVMGALRRTVVSYFSFPSFLAKAVQTQRWFLFLLLLPAVLFYGLLGLGQDFGWAEFARVTFEDGGLKFDRFVPHWLIYSVFFPASAFVVLVFAVGGWRMWQKWAGNGEEPKQAGLMESLKDVFLHRRFDKCDEGRWRFLGHLGIFYGFVFLAITTAATIVMMYGFGQNPPLSFSPSHFIDGLLWKIIGNFGALILIVGTWLAIQKRLGAKDQISHFCDYAFLGVIMAIAVTGLGSEILRLLATGTRSAGVGKAAYLTYYLHLVFVFYLIFYAPYSKMAHIVYRTLALVFARSRGRIG
jgi:quinone-modifying oxidoreductase subunit QmoC